MLDENTAYLPNFVKMFLCNLEESIYSVYVCDFYQKCNNGVARTLKKVTHINGRLLDRAVILFNFLPI